METFRDSELETLAVHQALLCPRVRDVLHDTCSQALFVGLPAEAQVMIARFTGPVWYLTVLAEIPPLFEEVRRAPPHPRHLSLTHPAYVTRLEYQGHSYLSGIRGKGSRKRINNRQQRINLPRRVEKVVSSHLRRSCWCARGAIPGPDFDTYSRRITDHPGIKRLKWRIFTVGLLYAMMCIDNVP